MKKIVSIIIPAYNAAKSIFRSVNSCLKQTYPFIETIVINDGSKDKTAQILMQEFRTIKNITIFNKANEGVGKARNDGINLATGDYLYFLDADDYLEPDAIQLMVSAIEANSADIAISGYTIKSGEQFNSIRPQLPIKKTALENFIVDKIISSPWAKLFRADIIKKNGIIFSDYKIMQDGFFNIRYFCEVKKITIVNKALYIYDKGLSTSTASMPEEKLRLIMSAMAEQEKIAVEHASLPSETIKRLFIIRRLRLAVLFPLQCASRNKLIKQEAKQLVSQGLLTHKGIGLHEKMLISMCLLNNKAYDLTDFVLKYIKKLTH